MYTIYTYVFVYKNIYVWKIGIPRAIFSSVKNSNLFM